MMNIIACMSGTSLDGLDILFCQFKTNLNRVTYNISHCKTYSYSSIHRQKLAQAHQISALDLVKLDYQLSEFFSEKIAQFIQEYSIEKVDYIASHGHTIFHQPQNGFTTQIGNGLQMAQRLKIPVVYDFRSADVFNGGQGAPLVPIGDDLLFSEYDYCLNIGGFSNVSYRVGNHRIAFDVSPANIVLNALSMRVDKPYDHNGDLARKGEIIPEVLTKLNQLDYFQQAPPKSLGKEWVEQYVMPLLSKKYATANLLSTYTEHIAIQIATVLKEKNSKTLVSGGGAYNQFLIERIKEYSSSKMIIPSSEIVEFKESLIFGLLAYLKVLGKTNVLASVTGAKSDSSSGLIAYP